MNAIIRDGPAAGAVVEVPQPPPKRLSVEVRPEVPEGPIQPGDEFPTVSGPAYAYRLAQPIGMVGTQIANDPATMTWMAFYAYEDGANAELAGNGHLHWPHRGTLNWPHPALVVGVCR
jgi:hypothetical protein